jgi:predicted enzyme related to lactoylglutathione lyase
MTDVVARVGAVMIDCQDPESLAAFWGELTGTVPEFIYPEYIFMSKLPGNHIRLAFQKVPESKTVKNRVHLDLGIKDPEVFIKKVVELGGGVNASHQMSEGPGWTVLTDPEGNEFCITTPHEEG